MSAERAKTLVMFSGGKDSFLSAIREVVNGRDVRLLSFDSGHMVGHRELRLCGDRLTKKYGRQRAEYLGCYNTSPTVNRLNEYWLHSTQAAIAAEYPNLTNCQVQCLHCQTAMWLAAIATAESRAIWRVAAGYKASDVFCTGQPFFVDAMRDLAKRHNVEVSLPVWDLGDDYERDTQIAVHQFSLVRCEPKCLAGQAPRDGGDPAVFDDMRRYLEDRLLPLADDHVTYLVPIFQHMKFTDVPFQYDIEDDVDFGDG